MVDWYPARTRLPSNFRVRHRHRAVKRRQPHGVRETYSVLRLRSDHTVAVRIRLLRMGKIRNPQYRIVVADSRVKRDGRAIEYVGIYQPKEDPSVIQVKSDRVQYWLSVGAQPSEAVQRILEKTGDWQQ